jgi:hypothetical protein
VHFGLASDKAADRRVVLTDARARHPHRFGTTHAPKILDLPDTAWINRPAQDTIGEADTTAALTPDGLIHLEKFRTRNQGVSVVPKALLLKGAAADTQDQTQCSTQRAHP